MKVSLFPWSLLKEKAIAKKKKKKMVGFQAVMCTDAHEIWNVGGGKASYWTIFLDFIIYMYVCKCR